MSNASAPTHSRERFIDPKLHRITTHASVREFLSAPEIPPGFNVIHEGGLPIDIQVNDRGHRTTLVSLHGAVTPKYRLPYLAGLGVTRDVAVNRISISDPTLLLDPALNLAWFAGSLRQRLQLILPSIIRKVLTGRPEVERLIFFGSSGGGFASLFYASGFPGSYAVISNPQTSIGKYVPAAVAKYANAAFDVEQSATNPVAHLPADIVDDVVKVYAEPVDTTVLYAQNATDDFHLRNHVKPFFAQLHPRNRVWWKASNQWGEGHAAPPKDFFVQMLHAAAAGEVLPAAEGLGFKQAHSLGDLGLNL